jgi:Outer membrane lipoprotein-sorting protein
MRKIFALAVSLFIFSFSFAQSAPKRDMSEFAAVRTIESGFKMSKHISIAQNPLESEGKFYFQNPGSLRWEYSNPYNYGFIIHDGKTVSWQEKDGKAEVRDISSQPAAKEMAQQLYIFVSMDMEKISKFYRTESFDGGIVLYPKNNSKKQMINDIKIYFSEKITAVREVVISERSGDKTVITFSDTKIDGLLPQNAFTV